MKTAKFEQEGHVRRIATGTVTSHAPGVLIEISWLPGHASGAREHLTRAYREIVAQISDADDESDVQ